MNLQMPEQLSFRSLCKLWHDTTHNSCTRKYLPLIQDEVWDDQLFVKWAPDAVGSTGKTMKFIASCDSVPLTEWISNVHTGNKRIKAQRSITNRMQDTCHRKWSGAWFNIKMSSYQYRKSHCGDKTVVRSSYLHNGISYIGKMSSLYWIRTLLFADLYEWQCII